MTSTTLSPARVRQADRALGGAFAVTALVYVVGMWKLFGAVSPSDDGPTPFGTAIWGAIVALDAVIMLFLIFTLAYRSTARTR